MKPRDAILFGLLTALALWFRFSGLGAEGLWVDEAYTVSLSTGPLAEILARLRVDDAPPVYYLIQKGILSLLGRSESAARLLSALSGFGAAVGLFLLLRPRRLGGAFLTYALAAGSVILAFYARQARSYAFVHLLTVLYWWAVLAFLRAPGARRAAGTSALGLLLLYTHNLGLWIVGAGLVSTLPRLRAATRRPTLVLLIGTALGALPWGLGLFGQVAVHRQLNTWMAAYWNTHPLWAAPLLSLSVMANGASAPFHPPVPLPALPASFTLVRWLLWATALLGLSRSLWEGLARRRGNEPSAALEIRTAIVFAALPLLGPLAASPFTGPTYVLGRTDSLAVAPLLLLVGVGWSLLPWRWFGPASALLWIAAGAVSFQGFADGPRAKGSDRALGALLERSIGSRDVIVATSLSQPTLQYYAERQGWGDRATIIPFPASTGVNPAAVYPLPVDSLAAWQAEARRLRDLWETEARERVWVLAILHGPEGRVPARPAAPAPPRDRIDANALRYPENLLVSTLVGLEPVPVACEYRQDWVSGDRVLLRIDRAAWMPLDALPPVQIAP